MSGDYGIRLAAFDRRQQQVPAARLDGAVGVQFRTDGTGEIDVEARERAVAPDVVEGREILLGHEADARAARQIAAFEAAFRVDEARNHKRALRFRLVVSGLGRAGARHQQRQKRGQRKKQPPESRTAAVAPGITTPRFSARHLAFALPDPLQHEV